MASRMARVTARSRASPRTMAPTWRVRPRSRPEMAGTIQTGGRARTIAAINVTPLVDVVLVLLVILMVASTYIVAQTMKVQLPKAHATDGPAEKPSTVQLLKDGRLRWNEQEITDGQLQANIKTAVAADPE